ncbi:hypothetical protein B0H16DRAFT_1507641 [Mycena metata]|uniref:Uncharacterized protein n=1 Tax=Mycena metata TaxID=1033252 RepID=A0AAD7K036_9AGAR|nr:hypothetical protein B0H16DRAFT_1507641 [Mycena metata]
MTTFEMRTFLVPDSDDEETGSFKDYRGTGVPPPSLGALGDTYIDIEGSMLYGYCANGWTQWPGPAHRSAAPVHPSHDSLFLWCNASEKQPSWMQRSKMKRSKGLSASELISQIVTSEAPRNLKRKADAVPEEADSREKRPNITPAPSPVPEPSPPATESGALAWRRCDPPPKSSLVVGTPDLVPPDLVPLHMFPTKLLSPPAFTSVSQPKPPFRGIPSMQSAPVMLNFLYATTHREPQHFVGVQSPAVNHALDHPAANITPEKVDAVLQTRLSQVPIRNYQSEGISTPNSGTNTADSTEVSIQHPLLIQSPSAAVPAHPSPAVPAHPSPILPQPSPQLNSLPRHNEIEALNQKLSKLISHYRVTKQERDTLRQERDMLQHERDALQEQGGRTTSQVQELFAASKLLYAKSEAQKKSIHEMQNTIQRLQADNENLRKQGALATPEASTRSSELPPRKAVVVPITYSQSKNPNVSVKLEPLNNLHIGPGNKQQREVIDLTLSDDEEDTVGTASLLGNTVSTTQVARKEMIGSTKSPHMPPSSPAKVPGPSDPLGRPAASVSSLPPPAQQQKWVEPSPSKPGHFLIAETEFSDTQLIELVRQRGPSSQSALNRAHAGALPTKLTENTWGQILLHLELLAKGRHQNFQVPRLRWSDTCAALEHYYLWHIVGSRSAAHTPPVAQTTPRSPTAESPTDADAVQHMLVDAGAGSALSEVSRVTVATFPSPARAAPLVANAQTPSETNVGANMVTVDSVPPNATPGQTPSRNGHAIAGDHESGDNMQQNQLDGDVGDSNHGGEMEEVKDDTPEIRPRRLTQTHLEILWTNYEGVFFCDACGANGVTYEVGTHPNAEEEMLEHSEGQHADVCDIITTKTAGMNDEEIQDWLKEIENE